MIIIFDTCKVSSPVKAKEKERWYARVSEPYGRAALNINFDKEPAGLKVDQECKLTLIGSLGAFDKSTFFVVNTFKQE